MERDAMIVAGFGFTSSASADSLRSALAATGHAAVPLHGIATHAAKADSAVWHAFAATMSPPAQAIPAAQIAAMHTRTQSPHSRAARATGSVAEAAALAAAGPGATLIVSRHISTDRMATCAIAKGAAT